MRVGWVRMPSLASRCPLVLRKWGAAELPGICGSRGTERRAVVINADTRRYRLSDLGLRRSVQVLATISRPASATAPGSVTLESGSSGSSYELSPFLLSKTQQGSALAANA